MKRIIYLSITILMFAACKETKVTDNEIIYRPEILDSKEATSLPLDTVKTDIAFARPQQMDFVTDSLIVVFDEIGNKNVGLIVTRNGKQKGQFGMIGKGYGEIIRPEIFSVGKDRNSIYFFDLQMHHNLKYNIDDILANKKNATTIKYEASGAVKDNYITKMLNISDTDYIVFGYDNNLRIQNIKSNVAKTTYTDFPEVDENEEHKWSIWTNMAKVSISPDGKHLVIGTAIGAMFEVFNVEDGKIEKTTFKAFHKPIYTLAKGAHPACVVSTEDTMWGFTSLYCTDKSFWGVMGGEKYEGRNAVYEFDYSGELLNKYKIDDQIETFAVTPDRELYFIATDIEGDTHMMKAALNSI